MEPKGVAVFGEIAIDFDRMEIRHSGRLIAATAQEFRLLKFFVDNPEYVFTREELLSAAWPRRERINGRSVDNFIALLRRKIEDDPSRPVFFQTVHGVGYKFEPFGETVADHGVKRNGGLTLYTSPRDVRNSLRTTTGSAALSGSVQGKSRP